MSKNKHTPEPWYVVDKPWGNGTWINSGSPDPHHEGFVADCEDMNGDVDKDTARINARRITACVNACAGCATEVLETAPVGFFNSTYGHPKYLEEITKQRDELLAELEWCAKSLNPNNERTKRVFDAIASAKGINPVVKESLTTETSVPAIVFYPAGSLGEEVQP